MRSISLLLLFLSMHAYGTTPSASETFPTDRTEVEQQQKALLEQAEQQRESLRQQQSPSAPPEVQPEQDEGVCRNVRHIAIEGSTVLSLPTQKTIVAPWQHRCLTVSHMRQLVRAISQRYLERGYVTSQAWLPEQDVSTGVLRIAITEGRIESITQQGKTPHSLAMVFPGNQGRLLNLRDLEQGLEQLNRLTSQPVTIDIQPGHQSGYSRILIVSKRKAFPASVSFSADNSGQKKTGVAQMSSSATLDNPFQLAERWNLSATHNATFQRDRRNRSLSGGVTLPYGYWLFSYQHHWNDFHQPIPGSRWRYQGMSQSQRFGINRTLFRDGNQKLAFDVALTRRRTENRLADRVLTNSSTTVNSVALSPHYSRRIGKGFATLNPTVSWGLRGLGATKDRPHAPDAPRSQFLKYSISASYLFPLAPSLYYLTSAYAQTSQHNLHTNEQIAVGGHYSVRGFKEQSLSGIQGAYWRNEINWQPGIFSALGDITLIAALDGGWVKKQRGRTEGGSIVGAALGLTLNARHFAHSITLGKPLIHPDTLAPDRWALYWQTTLAF
ncbi:ShlB/FhaC/HecB family hemolysin secretion/activation protein [Candidatus Symbiopectobacterium sp. NZEC127]|uniref:ShlB/FhaC/HecB family hemolysin secretion/activation protein n=1 Tax=Candidatus Symbiopectobacterium sp. NZEC127 TaxID=2820472 RepID=UPI002225F794|nr:ShlB/FhaC/HecB family hemolysin secretion/activation protein [Candidatus Symbiopectobacterium sp. NZEC127]MCW2487142.1 ShlB/FhaC/HecB family hemolysin secretion/activation protein [Candidatus Symbiopectobacterium sp. NZEC127]